MGLSVILAGFCAFVSLYAVQPMLPLLAGVFATSQAMVSLALTVATVGVALAAPLAGQLADRVGRRRVILGSAFVLSVATLLNATAPNLGWLLFWRFVQGVATPGVFSVTTAFVHDEWPPGTAARGISHYVSGTILGGFSGRVIAGFTAEHLGWRAVFVVLGSIVFVAAAGLAWWLPAEKNFRRGVARADLAASALRHLRNPRLVAAYTVGFGVLFSLIAMFTYVTFHLAAPPFSLGPGLLGSTFVVYLVGAAVTPVAGRFIDRMGHGRMLLCAAGLGATGALITLAPNLWVVLLGLAVCCSGVFISQAAATAFVGAAAERDRALALGLYVCFYYLGGSAGSSAPGWIWQSLGWPGCVALVVAVQLGIAGMGARMGARIFKARPFEE